MPQLELPSDLDLGEIAEYRPTPDDSPDTADDAAADSAPDASDGPDDASGAGASDPSPRDEVLDSQLPTWPQGGALPLDQQLRSSVERMSIRGMLPPLRLAAALGAVAAVTGLAVPGWWVMPWVLASVLIMPAALVRQRRAHRKLVSGRTEAWQARVTDLGREDEPDVGPWESLRWIVDGDWPGSVQTIRIQATFGEITVLNRGENIASGAYRLVIRSGFDHLVLAGEGGVRLLRWAEVE